MSDTGLYQLGGVSGVCVLSLQSARKLISAAQPGDGTALWVVAMLHNALIAILACWVGRESIYEAYTSKSVQSLEKAVQSADPAGPHMLRMEALDALNEKLLARGKGFDAVTNELVRELSGMRNFLLHPKPISIAYEHDHLSFVVEITQSVLRLVCNEARDELTSDVLDIDVVLGELSLFEEDFRVYALSAPRD